MKQVFFPSILRFGCLDADIENRLMAKGGVWEGEGEKNEESSMEAYTLSYVK